jgi:hypothetical protein
MASIQKWAGVAVAMQSALAAAVTISGITKANPAVVSYASGTDPVNGDYVYVLAQGMSQVNGRVFRCANVNGAGNTFELEGVDSTLFGTFTSGTFQVITFGTTFNVFSDVSVSGGDFDFLDSTLIHDLAKSQIPNQANATVFNFTAVWDPADAGLIAAKNASDNQAQRAFRITWPNGYKYLFTGYVGANLAPAGSAGDKVTTPVAVTAFGTGTAYAT